MEASTPSRGIIRVGRVIEENNIKATPSYEGFMSAVILLSWKEYGCLTPYELTDDDGVILNNKWEFSKVYDWVPKTLRTKSQWSKDVIREYPLEYHYIEGTLFPNYWAWRSKGMACTTAIRYPVGTGKQRHEYLFSIKDEQYRRGNDAVAIPEEDRLDDVEARKQIYLPDYIEAVKKQPMFMCLQGYLNAGTNLLISELNGPHQESMDYYRDMYRVSDDFIERDTMLASPSNIGIMLNDTTHPFGHGYMLAMALLDMSLDDHVPS